MISHITEAEMEIMQILWSADGSVTSKEIAAKLPDKKLTTIITLAGRLIDKGLVKSEKVGRSHSHQYVPVISEEAYKKAQTRDFVETVHKGSAKSLLSALFEDRGLTGEDVAMLQDLIERMGEKK